MLSAFSEKHAPNHGAMWEALLIYCRHFPAAWDSVDVAKAVLPRLTSFLRCRHPCKRPGIMATTLHCSDAAAADTMCSSVQLGRLQQTIEGSFVAAAMHAMAPSRHRIQRCCPSSVACHSGWRHRHHGSLQP